MTARSAQLLAFCTVFCSVVWIQLGLAHQLIPARLLRSRNAQDAFNGPSLSTLERHKQQKKIKNTKPGAKLRILLTSDSHGVPRERWDFGRDLPPADLLIHCGDVSDLGHIDEYKKVVKSFMSHPAKFKIFIGGNHDLTLDKGFMEKNAIGKGKKPVDPSLAGDKGKVLKEVDDALAVFKTDEAKKAGISFLDQGMHDLYVETADKKKVLFKAFVSPYTPSFHNYAFSADPSSKRFNNKDGHAYIPDLPEVRPDFVITHGPPKGILDRTGSGASAGDQQLYDAVARVKPLLHVFGHVHEGAGVLRKNWKTGATTPLTERELDLGKVANGLKKDDETLFLNVAEKDAHFKNTNPWRLVTMDWGLAHHLDQKKPTALSKAKSKVHGAWEKVKHFVSGKSGD